MANLKVKTIVEVVSDIETNDYDVDYTIEDILQDIRSQAKVIVADAIDNDTANVTTITLESVLDGT